MYGWFILYFAVQHKLSQECKATMCVCWSLSRVQPSATPWTPCLPGSSVHGILQARILEWGAIPFSRGSSRPRGWNRVSHIAGRFFTNWATREAQKATIFQFKKEEEFIIYKTWRTMTYIDNQPCSINMGSDPWMWPPRRSWGPWALGGDWSHLLWLLSGPSLSSCFHAVSSKHLHFFQLVSQHRNLKWWGGSYSKNMLPGASASCSVFLPLLSQPCIVRRVCA